MKNLIPYSLLALFSFAGSFLFGSPNPNPIRNVDFEKYLIQRDKLTKLCQGEPPIKNIQVNYAEITGDGKEEAIVEATSCAMGNGGADIVEVFQLKEDKTLQSLKIDESKFAGNNLYQGQFRTPRLEESNGRLTRWFVKRSAGGSAGPSIKRVVTYRWVKDHFEIENVQDIPHDQP